MSNWLEQYQATKERKLEELGEFLAGFSSEDQKGGPGSGHWGHAGRPGKRGGSLPANVAVSIRTGKTARERQAAAAARGKTPELVGAAGARAKIAAIQSLYGDIENELQDKIDGMRAIKDQKIAKLKEKYPGMWEEKGYRDGYGKIRPTFNEIYEVEEERRRVMDESREKQRQVLYVDHPSEVEVKIPFRKGRKDRVMKGVEAFRNMVGVDSMDNHTITFVNKKKGRSSCRAAPAN